MSNQRSAIGKNSAVLGGDVGDSDCPAGLRVSGDSDVGGVSNHEVFFDTTNVDLGDLVVQVQRELLGFN